jgi:predicted amidohydrolase YtcJ
MSATTHTTGDRFDPVFPTPVELLVVNARVLNPAPLVGVSALAVSGGRIVAMGLTDELLRLVDGRTVVHDVRGSTVLPGFVDIHNHHLAAGVTDLFEVTFSPQLGLEEVLELVERRAQTLPAGEWVTGGSWGSTLLPVLADEGSLLRLDRAAGDHPLALSDDSHHNRWVNSRALELAGIDATTPNPDGGVIVRDAETGRATGLLLETAGLPVAAALARDRVLTAEQYSRASRRAIEMLHSFGVTAFQDAGASIEALTALRDLDAVGDLPAWVVTSLFVHDPLFGSAVVGEALFEIADGYRTLHHRPDFVKIFLDGVPPTRTAAFLEPYLAADGHIHDFRGETALTLEELERWLRVAAARGLSAKVHCTGDAAVRMFLDAVGRLRRDGDERTRFQIAHGQFIAEDDRRRMAGLGVSADISPYLWFPGIIPDAIAEVLPGQRAELMQPNRHLLDLGVVVAGGSDWPVSETPDPWVGIQGLVTRADPSGVHPGTLWAEQAVTVQEALEIFTINGAIAMGIDDVAGSLEVGKSADFIVVDQDPYTVEPERLAATRVLETWFAGTQVYSR